MELRIGHALALACCLELSGCITTPIGPMPALLPTSSTEYFLYRPETTITLSSGDVFELATACLERAAEEQAKAFGARSGCLSNNLGVFLRRGNSWHALSDPFYTNPNKWDEIFVPANFRSSSTLTFLYAKATFSATREWASLGPLNTLTVYVLAPDLHSIRQLVAPVLCGIEDGFHEYDVSVVPQRRNRMAVVLQESTLMAFVQIPTSPATPCDDDMVYDVGTVAPEAKHAIILIGATDKDGLMKTATRNRSQAAADPAHFVFYEGQLPVSLSWGPVQSPKETNPQGLGNDFMPKNAAECEPNSSARLAFYCAPSPPPPISRWILCRYHGAGFIGSTGPKLATSFQDCRDIEL